MNRRGRQPSCMDREDTAAEEKPLMRLGGREHAYELDTWQVHHVTSDAGR